MSRHTLATMYGVGLVPRAPGTAGSAVAALMAVPILLIPQGHWLLAIGCLIFTVLGTRSAARYMHAHGTDHDPKEIVVDELAGQWLTLVFPLLPVLLSPGAIVSFTLPAAMGYAAIGCGLFRFFDILKPWPISWADRTIEGGWGVMFDDLLAGVAAGIVGWFLFGIMIVGN